MGFLFLRTVWYDVPGKPSVIYNEGTVVSDLSQWKPAHVRDALRDGLVKQIDDGQDAPEKTIDRGRDKEQK